jgi:3-dehydroquinate synthetase
VVQGKNLVGTFYHPGAILIDGMAEVIKVAFTLDCEFFWLAGASRYLQKGS